MKNIITDYLPEPKTKVIDNVLVTYYEGGNAESTIILLHGWPQTSHIWRKVFKPLTEKHRVIAIDLPGMGNNNTAEQTDTKHIASIINGLQKALNIDKFHLAGHDIGAWVATAFANDFEERLKSLIVMDAGIPGLIPDEVFVPGNAGKIWQFYFHSIKGLPEFLIEGKEKEYISWYFTNKSVIKEAIGAEDIEHYYQAYKGKERLANGFAYYQAFPENCTQNNACAKDIAIPILAIGGEKAQGLNMGTSMNKISTNKVTAVSIPDCGHYIPEEQPEELLRVLENFFLDIEKV